MTQLPMWIDQWGRPTPHVGSGSGRPFEHPCRVAQLRNAGFGNPNGYQASFFGLRSIAAARCRTGREQQESATV